MSRFAEQSPERQIPWLPGERFELALDSRDGAINASTAGQDTLTVTTHRVIRLGGSGGAKITEVAPLDRVSAVQVLDITRDNGKLQNGLIALVVGIALGWLTWVIFQHVLLFTLIFGGIPLLFAVFQLTGWLFPDEEGALILHAAGHMIRQPLLSDQARHDAYLVAHRIYELIARAGPTPAPATPQAAPEPTQPQLSTSPAAPPPSTSSVSSNGTGVRPEVAAVLSASLTPDNAADVPDVAERISKAIEATGAATSYVTHQAVRDPGNEGHTPGDYVWDMEFVAPDRYRVSQTGWSETGEVHERWMVVGADFYRETQGTWRKAEDPERFAAERAVTSHLSPQKYIDILRQGFPSEHEVDTGGGKRYLQVTYDVLTREALASVLANPSPPQGVIGAAKLWVDMDTDLLAKAEVRIAERDGERKLVFEQAFASYGAQLDVAPPGEAASSVAPTLT